MTNQSKTAEGLRLDEAHELADMAIKRGANRPELGEMNVPPAGLDPVIRQARPTENAGRCFLGEPPACVAGAVERIECTLMHLQDDPLAAAVDPS